ncbi:MAG: hypothetical protein AB1499_01235 [Nitrospirota bacterium]
MNEKRKQSRYSSLEDVDRSCVHVVIAIGVVFAVLAYLICPSGILDIPAGKLTAGHVLKLTGTAIFGVISILILIDVINVFRKR